MLGRDWSAADPALMSAVSLGQWAGPRGEQGKVSAFNQTLLHTRATLVLAVPQGVNQFTDEETGAQKLATYPR